jgi:hypothetical protein
MVVRNLPSDPSSQTASDRVFALLPARALIRTLIRALIRAAPDAGKPWAAENPSSARWGSREQLERADSPVSRSIPVPGA